ncbi:hypothetical protein KVT40_004457 [Elsinoe batatas]|uniref:F-box domain-containing protein n=1 Tax=Elsinoe batatas TaxID=2601811 RepID=A0A8K0L4Z4_9PEZI|nr:hypothetical protein KVT40_004457 [Elsinoe batatas]
MNDTRSAREKFCNNPDLVRYLFLHTPLPALVCAIKVCKLWETTYRCSKAVQVTAWSSSYRAEDIWTIPPFMLRRHKPSDDDDASDTCPNARYIIGDSNGICDDRYWIVRPAVREFTDTSRELNLTGLIKDVLEDAPDSRHSFLDAFISQPPPMRLHTSVKHPRTGNGTGPPYRGLMSLSGMYHKRGVRVHHLRTSFETGYEFICTQAQQLNEPLPNKSDSKLNMSYIFQRLPDVSCPCQITDVMYSDGTIAMHIVRMDQKRFHSEAEDNPEGTVYTNLARYPIAGAQAQGGDDDPLTSPDHSTSEEDSQSEDEDDDQDDDEDDDDEDDEDNPNGGDDVHSDTIGHAEAATTAMVVR